jgi:hypothetical protein
MQLIAGYRKRTLGCLQPDNCLRRRVIQLIHSKWFDQGMVGYLLPFHHRIRSPVYHANLLFLLL